MSSRCMLLQEIHFDLYSNNLKYLPSMPFINILPQNKRNLQKLEKFKPLIKNILNILHKSLYPVLTPANMLTIYNICLFLSFFFICCVHLYLPTCD